MKIQILFAAVLLFSIVSCKKNNSDPVESEYSNKLTLGTGADYNTFSITGESYTFTKTGPLADIFWRLESAEDMNGSKVKMKLEKKSGAAYTSYREFEYPNPQSSGHIMISYFNIQDSGNYKVTGVLVNGNIDIASKEFQVQ